METGEVDTQPTTPSAKKTQLRPKWSNGLEGKLALMASMVTPFEDFAMASNMYFMGGGLIFIPLYLFFLALIGVPMLLLEVGVGQFSGRGTWCAWNIAPLFKGIGYLVTIINGHAAITTFWHLMAQFVFCYDLAYLGPEKASVFAHCENLTENALEGDYGDIYMNVTYDEYGMVSTPRCEAKTIFA
ncbi:sodium-dependent proline transporter-like [Amphibalanus amphitrite]|uniref:sodium-dependent proline transporter-like n=1 Tax=Amphibalanus amphitrite TaxID=1232801 RepID=UPI001C9205C6|nr:sodium-dependent proline transporter-like [Amphibalanus amphitrite]